LSGVGWAKGEIDIWLLFVSKKDGYDWDLALSHFSMNELKRIDPRVSLVFADWAYSRQIYCMAAVNTKKLFLKIAICLNVLSSTKLVEKCSSKSRKVTKPKLESMYSKLTVCGSCCSYWVSFSINARSQGSSLFVFLDSSPVSVSLFEHSNTCAMSC
jgi:hypothetical protein